ncbi:ubiquitin thioesterase OTU1 [Ceratina calcarata]|uniref:Ubiquitin thioesterase OTU n=1 Tax=Ceratina calcarata TaxID=156304 RepID=A0AAJ7NEH0_9HYME|nr:ubiquitin thioesterase OTU1 [Ceratina calcarata]
MANYVLRVKTKSGQKVVNGLLPTDQLVKLKSKLVELTEIPSEALHVLCGFPPRPINMNDESASLEKSGINSGDTLIVEEKPPIYNGTQNKDIGRSHILEENNFDNKPGVFMKKVVPADNSCLFTSVGYVLNGKIDPSCASYMREIIANAVASDPDEYSEAFLGRPNPEYCKWILKPESWGGAIELSILSKFYGLEIAIIDSINAIINRFGEDQQYSHRVFLIFDGIHYDPLYWEPLDGGSIQTMFPTRDEKILFEAAELAKEVKSSRQFTDVQKFTLMCNDCKARLNGQLEARQHAKETGHMNFGEVAV